MAPVAEFVDVSVRLTAGMPFYPGNPEFELQPIKRIANGLPAPIVGGDGAPARVVLKR